MTDKTRKTILALGGTLVITASGMTGYFVGENQVPTDDKVKIIYKWEEKEMIRKLWNVMLETKKANCENEEDCRMIDGVPYLEFKDITKENIPEKLNGKVNQYDIILKKKQ